MADRKVYMDNSATTPVRQEVVDSMMEYFQAEYGNPSSLHTCGQETREAVENARRVIAGCLNTDPKFIYFTSCGSESDNMAIKGIAMKNLETKGHIITSKIEHKAVLETVKYLEKLGFSATYLDVDKYGTIHPETLLSAIRQDTLLVSVMWANNEVGTIEPIGELSAICHERGIPFHTDAVQVVGKLPVNLKDSKVNMLAASAHKFYGPKGTGFLYMDDFGRKKIHPLIHGGSHERKMRAGTENVAGIIGMAEALRLATLEMEETEKRLTALGNYLENGLKEKLEGVHINGHPETRLRVL
jgi:cysteine desulfurase